VLARTREDRPWRISAGAKMPGDRLPAIVALGQVRVVSAAHQADVPGAVVAAEAVGVAMVILEPTALSASPALRVHVAASLPVSFAHRPPDRGGNVARRRLVGLRECLPRSLRPREAPGLEPFQLFRYRNLDDRGQVSVGDLRAHQGPEPLQLLVEL